MMNKLIFLIVTAIVLFQSLITSCKKEDDWKPDNNAFLDGKSAATVNGNVKLKNNNNQSSGTIKGSLLTKKEMEIVLLYSALFSKADSLNADSLFKLTKKLSEISKNDDKN